MKGRLSVSREREGKGNGQDWMFDIVRLLPAQSAIANVLGSAPTECTTSLQQLAFPAEDEVVHSSVSLLSNEQPLPHVAETSLSTELSNTAAQAPDVFLGMHGSACHRTDARAGHVAFANALPALPLERTALASPTMASPCSSAWTAEPMARDARWDEPAILAASVDRAHVADKDAGKPEAIYPPHQGVCFVNSLPLPQFQLLPESQLPEDSYVDYGPAFDIPGWPGMMPATFNQQNVLGQPQASRPRAGAACFAGSLLQLGYDPVSATASPNLVADRLCALNASNEASSAAIGTDEKKKEDAAVTEPSGGSYMQHARDVVCGKAEAISAAGSDNSKAERGTAASIACMLDACEGEPVFNGRFANALSLPLPGPANLLAVAESSAGLQCSAAEPACLEPFEESHRAISGTNCHDSESQPFVAELSKSVCAAYPSSDAAYPQKLSSIVNIDIVGSSSPGHATGTASKAAIGRATAMNQASEVKRIAQIMASRARHR